MTKADDDAERVKRQCIKTPSSSMMADLLQRLRLEAQQRGDASVVRMLPDSITETIEAPVMRPTIARQFLAGRQVKRPLTSITWVYCGPCDHVEGDYVYLGECPTCIRRDEQSNYPTVGLVEAKTRLRDGAPVLPLEVSSLMCEGCQQRQDDMFEAIEKKMADERTAMASANEVHSPS